MSDIPGTSTVTPGSAAIARSLAQGKKKLQRSKIPKVTPTTTKTQRKLEPYRPKSPPSAPGTAKMPPSYSKSIQSSFNLKGLVTPENPMDTLEPSTSLYNVEMTDISTFKEDKP